MAWRFLTRGVTGVAVAVMAVVAPAVVTGAGGAPDAGAPVVLATGPLAAPLGAGAGSGAVGPALRPAVRAVPAGAALALAGTPGLARPTTWRDLAYGTAPRQKLDLYLPAAAGPSPLVLYLHGGGWVAGDKAGPDDLGVITALAGHGYAVASVNYRLATDAVFPAQIDDARAALAWLRANAGALGVDPGRVGVFGVSAGAHLAVLLGVLERTPAVRVVVDWAGPIDLATVGADLAARPDCDGAWADPQDPSSFWAALVGGPVASKPFLVAAADPINLVASADPATLPRFLLAHGDRDCTVPVRQSERFAEAVRAVGRPDAVVLRVVRGSGHVRQFARDSELPVALQFLDAALG